MRLVIRGEGQIEDDWFVPSLSGAEVRVETKALGTLRSAMVRARWEGLGEAPPARVQPGGTAVLSLRDFTPKPWTPAEPNLDPLEVRLETADGRLLVCGLDLLQCAGIDPAARLFARNLLKSAR